MTYYMCVSSGTFNSYLLTCFPGLGGWSVAVADMCCERSLDFAFSLAAARRLPAIPKYFKMFF